MKRKISKKWNIVIFIFLIYVLSSFPAFSQTTELVSISQGGVSASGVSNNASISADGRFIAFSSSAPDLVPNDTNRTWDVFVFDTETGIIERVSVNTQGTEGNGLSTNPSISGDGRYVAFESYASNLVTDDTNGTLDIFVFDRLTGETGRISVNALGNGGNNYSRNAFISADGRFVAFESASSNLVPGDSNSTLDIFVYDRKAGFLGLISADQTGRPGNSFSLNPSVSADGRFVAFESRASNLVAGDTNFAWDVFVYDRQTGVIELASVKSDGGKANSSSQNASISGDGRYVVFSSNANLVADDVNKISDVYLRDRMTGTTERISSSNGMEANGVSDFPVVSVDGRYVAFESSASNLIPGDTNGATDVLVLDREKNMLELVSANEDGMQGNSFSGKPAISSDGLFIAFESNSTNLDLRDSNSISDIYLRERMPDNNPPVADAGPDQTVTCAGVNGTEVILDGSGSSDPDGDELTYVWTGPDGPVTGITPTVTLPLGTYEFELTVDDGNGGTGSDSVMITVEDVTPPATTAVITVANILMVAQTTDVKEWYNSDVQVLLTATDNCIGCETIYAILDGAMSEAKGSTYSIAISDDGIHELIYWSVDGAGNIESRKSQIIKIDKMPPTLTITADPNYLWPANGKMMKVAIQGQVSDASPIQSASIKVVDEYRRIEPSIEGLSGTVKLKAWRKKKDKDGRHYTIIAEAVDAAGNVSTATTEVVVPHDMRHHKNHHKKHKSRKNKKDHHDKKKSKKKK